MVRKILIRGANINYTNKQGKSALHFAIEGYLKESTIRYLIAQGADAHLEDING